MELACAWLLTLPVQNVPCRLKDYFTCDAETSPGSDSHAKRVRPLITFDCSCSPILLLQRDGDRAS